MTDDWEERVAAAWAARDDLDGPALRAAIADLVAELPAGDARGPFETACADDSTGRPDLAVAGYREALDRGLDPYRRRRATIQLASSLRNLGRAGDAVALLTPELDAPSDELDDAVRAFLALALTDVGRPREAVAVALTALAPHLPRYTRSVTAYAAALPAD